MAAVVAASLAGDAVEIREEAGLRRVGVSAVAPRADVRRASLVPWRDWLVRRVPAGLALSGDVSGEDFADRLRWTGAFRSLVAARDAQRARRLAVDGSNIETNTDA